MKTCFKCLCTLPLDSFYKHARMSDGRLNKCKACAKKDVEEHRQNNLEKIRAHDRFRSGMPHRVKARKEYRKTDAYKKSHAKSLRKNIVSNQKKYKARNAVSNALRDGRLEKMPCMVCGKLNAEAHHPDYDRPLDVVWLCNLHHRQAHDLVKRIGGQVDQPTERAA